jgi:nitric oxide reductase subunit B
MGLALLLAVSFSVLLWVGGEIHRVMPPIPEAVVTERGGTVFTRADIENGRQVWQSIGGQQLGSIWGHGSYVAPDWSADWLHREATAWLDIVTTRETSRAYSELSPEGHASFAVQLKPRIRANTYDTAERTVTIPTDRAAAIAQVAKHCTALFGNDPALLDLRKAMR